LSEIVKKLKHAGTYFIKTNSLFPGFAGWQSGYSAFTYHYSTKKTSVKYVQKEEEHHQKVTFQDELKALFEEHDIDINSIN